MDHVKVLILTKLLMPINMIYNDQMICDHRPCRGLNVRIYILNDQGATTLPLEVASTTIKFG